MLTGSFLDFFPRRKFFLKEKTVYLLQFLNILQTICYNKGAII